MDGDLPEQAVQLMKAAAPPGSNTADIDYMTSLWEGIHQFSNTMIKATKKYKKDITRKRKQPPSSKDEEAAIKPPPKKPKLSNNKSPKRPKPSHSTKNVQKKKKISNKPTSPRNKHSASPRKKPIAKSKSGNKSNANDSDRIYRIRRPRTSWVLFNAQKIASLLKEHPSLSLGQRTKLSSKAWHGLNDEDREEWTEKAEQEKLEYQRITKAFESHHDFEQIPTHWKQIDKKAEKERREKGEEKNKEISSKTKKKKKKKQIKKSVSSSPKQKKNKKKKCGTK